VAKKTKKVEKISDDVLHLKRPMMHGPAVKRVQEILDMLGFEPGDVDGIFGEASEGAVKGFQDASGLKVDGVCGPKTWDALCAAVDASSKDTGPMTDFMAELDRVHDIRKLHVPPRLASKKTPTRPWRDIVGVTVHQTGCNMPIKPQSWSRLNAHFGITKEGLVVFANDPTMIIWHAQGLSRSTIGIEIEGNYPGVMNDPSTLWKGGGPECTLNPNMLYAVQQLFVLLQWLFRMNRQKWTMIHGHRQSASSRMADPGEEIWKAIVLPWMKELDKERYNDARDGGDLHCIGTGRRIPLEWAPNRTCPYRCPPRKQE
jgi:hypothetical protein